MFKASRRLESPSWNSLTEFHGKCVEKCCGSGRRVPVLVYLQRLFPSDVLIYKEIKNFRQKHFVRDRGMASWITKFQTKQNNLVEWFSELLRTTIRALSSRTHSPSEPGLGKVFVQSRIKKCNFEQTRLSERNVPLLPIGFTTIIRQVFL